MKISEYLNNLAEGEIVTNKRFLAILKRKKLIYDYSSWGYLENAKLWYKYEDGSSNWTMGYIFKNANAPDVYEVQCETIEEVWKTYPDDYIEYNGVKFGTKYLSGCFNAYLYRISPNENLGKKNPKISLFGTII